MYYKQKQKYLIYISIQTLCCETRNCAQLHPVSIDHPSDVSKTWSPPVVNPIDWTWFGKAHTCLYKVSQLTVHIRKKQAMRLKELSVELRNWIVSRHIEGPQEQLPPSFLNGISLEPPKLFLELAAWPNWAIRGEGPWSGRWPRTWWALWWSPSLRWTTVVAASCCGEVFQRQGLGV